jgi:peptide/nickel transport system substrate-binding protein
MYKKIRKYWWLLTILIRKQYLFILLGIFINFILIFGFLSLIKNFNISKTDKIGKIGNYTNKNIPSEITKLISRGLTKIDKNGNYVTDLAEKITISNEGKIYQIKLKKENKWKNGKSFTTKDINYNFADVNFIIKNDLEGYFILKEKFAPFLRLLSIPITDDNFNGLGNYQVEKINYDGEFIKSISLNGPKKIIYKFYPNTEVASTAFKLGEINILQNVSKVDKLIIWKKVTIKKESEPKRFTAIFFSFKGNTPVQEKNFRQALAYATSRKIFIEKPAYSSYSYNSIYYTENVKKYFYDEESAKNLFNKFKGDSKKKISFTLYTNPEYELYANEIAKKWTTVLGFNAKVRTTKNIPYQWEAYLTTAEIPEDPDQYALWHSNKTFRFSNYRNLKLDKLLEDGRTEIDTKKRKELYDQVQKTLTEDLPAIFLFYPNSYTLSY